MFLDTFYQIFGKLGDKKVPKKFQKILDFWKSAPKDPKFGGGLDLFGKNSIIKLHFFWEAT